MESFITELSSFFRWLLVSTIQVSVLVCLILVIKVVIRRRLAVRWHYWLWLLLLVRMVIPWAPESSFSVFTLTSQAKRAVAVEHIVKVTPSTETVDVTEAVTPKTTNLLENQKLVKPAETTPQPTQALPGISLLSFEVIDVLSLCWLIVASGLGIFALACNFRLWRIIKSQRPLTEGKILDLLEDCKAEMGVPTILGLIVTDKVKSPALFGVVRPRLLLPEGTIKTLSTEQLRYVFLHELAHLKRHDIYLGWLMVILQVLHWFNPLVWLAFARMRADRELACDGLVLSTMGAGESQAYGQTLVNLFKGFSRTRYVPGIAGILENKSQLKRRITMIAQFKKGSYRWSALAVVLLAVLACVALTNAQAASQPENKEPTVMAEQFVELLVKGQFSKATENFDATMKKSLPADKLAETWRSTTGQAGLFKHQLGVREEKFLGSDIVLVTCEFEKGPLDVKVVYNSERKVSGLWFLPVPEGVLKSYRGQSGTERLHNRVTVDIDHSPNNEPLTVQYAVIAICEAAGILYQWEKSARLADPEQRNFTEPIHIEDVPLEKALFDVLTPAGLRYELDENGLYLYRPTGRRTSRDHRAEMRRRTETTRATTSRSRAGLAAPQVINTNPVALSNDVSPDLTEITVTFDQPMMNLSWSWVGGGETFPEMKGQPRYDRKKMTCSLPVKLEPGKFYWIGINSPRFKNFQTDMGVPAVPYAILFATKDKEGNPTPIPENFIEEAKEINSHSEEKWGVAMAKATDLQNLIDSAKPNGTVIIPDGVYTESIEITKPLTLKGRSRVNCIFEVTENKPAIFVDSRGKGKVTIEGLTIKWQLSTSDRVEHASALGVKDSKVEVKNCSFLPLGNFKRSPMAIRTIGFSNVDVSTCRFEGFGFAVFYNEGTKGTIRDSLIMNCQSQGITIFSGATVDIAGNIIAGSKKHAVRNTGGTLRMKDNLIINNANRGVYLGNKSANGAITNNIIMGNGTGISGFARSRVTIENNIIANNSYAGIGFRDSCGLQIRNNIFKGNQRGWIMFKEGGRNNNGCQRNTFWQNEIDAENFRKTANSILADPGFTDPENGDFSLKPGPALEHKQGLTNPQVFKTLWKRWQKREDKNEPFSKTGTTKANKMEAENLTAEGWRLWRQRQLAEAEAKFKQAVKKDAKNDNAYQGLGWAQLNQGKKLNAKDSFEKCVAINPKNSAALNGLG